MNERVKNVETALDLIEYLATEQKKVGVREASRILEVPKSTVQRIFNSLAHKGMVTFDSATERYQLSFSIMKYVSRFMDKNDLVTVSSPVLRELQREIGETVCLYVPVDNQIVPILQYESEEELRYSLKVGKPYPLNVGACGKLTAAYMEDQEQLKMVISSFEQEEAQQKFANELVKIREQGYAISRGEILPGVEALAVPIIYKEKFIASIGAYGPSVRMDKDVIRLYLDKLIQTKDEISGKLYSALEGDEFNG